MRTGSGCDCLVCRMEKSLAAELGGPDCHELLASQSGALARFASPLDLIRELHAQEARKESSSADVLLRELLHKHALGPFRPLCQRLLLLAFIPTIHRTTSHLAAVFPSLGYDDAAQHVVSVFLEFLAAPELGARGTHLAFTIARRLRRQAFRWAIHESRGVVAPEMVGDPVADVEVDNLAGEEPFYAEVFLDQFLDNCRKMGWLSEEERDLLVRFKIGGATCQELAGGNGHTAVAMQHRMQRLLDRLRRVAQKTRWEPAPEQLELFPR
jgi:hypothetical protein